MVHGEVGLSCTKQGNFARPNNIILKLSGCSNAFITVLLNNGPNKQFTNSAGTCIWCFSCENLACCSEKLEQALIHGTRAKDQ